MNTLITIVVTILLSLVGITKHQSNKMKVQKKELDKTKQQVKEKYKELEDINELQNKIKELRKEEKPKKKKAAISGDSSSRLDRLNKLHDN